MPYRAIDDLLGLCRIVSVDEKDRVVTPKELTSTLEWWSDKTTTVVAELVCSGHVRIYSGTAIEEVKSLASYIKETQPDTAEGHKRLQSLRDRYRALQMYKGGRIRITREVAMVLDLNLGDGGNVFVQAIENGLEIMAAEFRERRLEETSENTVIGLHLGQSKGK